MDVTTLDRARECHRTHAWADACDAFRAVDRVAPLAIEDLGRLAECTHVLGRMDEAVPLLQRLYHAHLDAGDIGRAMRTAFILWHALIAKGALAQAGGWLARARRLAGTHPECPQLGYLLVPEAQRHLGEGDHASAFDTAGRVAELAGRIGDHDLIAIAVHLQGRARIRQGRVVEGLALLDEALVEVTAGATAPAITSWIYCSVIDACRELQELRRAREWTLALNAWCDARPQYTGVLSAVCRTHRAELLLMDGAWPDAVREAQLACEQLTRGIGEAMAGPAFYQLAEARRLRGEASAAEEAYRDASRYGGPTQPGLALLWFAEGKVDASTAALRRALTETADPLERARLLPAYVEILLAGHEAGATAHGARTTAHTARTAAQDSRTTAHDPRTTADEAGATAHEASATAHEAAAELHETAQAFDTAALHARSAYALGAVHLAGGAPDKALPALRRAWRLWHDLDVRYEAARTRLLIGLACRALHDDGSAALELDAARDTFARLGAVTDLRHVDRVRQAGEHAGQPIGLTRREIEVLRLVATGRSNQGIGQALAISERTVERHISNIFDKLGVGSRTAAAAYAFEHGIH